jgi:VCBS repeat-containing protein
VVGKVTASDPDSTLTLTASKPAHGEVTVDPEGNFTYTPDETYDGHDSFTITASDADDGFHIHGLAGLINLVTFGLVGDRGTPRLKPSTSVVADTQPVPSYRVSRNRRISGSCRTAESFSPKKAEQSRYPIRMASCRAHR